MTISTRTLRFVTIGYLGAPMVAFVFGWLRLPIALAAAAAIAWFVVALARSKDHGDRIVAIPRWALVGLVVTSVLWVALSGIGGFGFQHTDYEKHDAILKTLIDSPWPVRLSGESQLVYYVGYYVLPALGGKLAGWHGAAPISALWGLAGVALALVWVGVNAQAMHARTFVVFALFGGLGLLGALIFDGVGGSFESWNVDNWTRMFTYPGNTGQLFWAPQHAIAGWLVTALVVHEDGTDGARVTGPWLLAFAALWSPFVALGVAPLVASSLWRGRARPSLLWLPPIGFGLVLLAFYAAVREPLPHGFAPAHFGWRFVEVYVPFCALQFGFYAALLVERPPLVRVAIVCLLAIPFYHLGLYDDFTLRTSIPPLYVIAVAVARELGRGRRRLFAPWAIGTTSSLAYIVLSLHHGPPLFTMVIATHPAAVTEIQPRAVAVQYVGRDDAWFFRVLAR